MTLRAGSSVAVWALVCALASGAAACGESKPGDEPGPSDEALPPVVDPSDASDDAEAGDPTVVGPDAGGSSDDGGALDGGALDAPASDGGKTDAVTPDAAPPPDVGSTTFIFAAAGDRASLAAAYAKAPATGRVVIVVPPGAWAWATGVSFASTRANTTLLGAGPAQTRLHRDNEETAPLLTFRTSKRIRVGELTVDGNASSSSTSKGFGVLMQNVVDYRVDHVAMAHHGAAAIRANQASTGVVDHAALRDMTKPAIGDTLGYGVVVMGVGALEGVPLGSPRATFIEDSIFTRCRHAVASNDGARYVFRSNRVTANVVSHAVDAHGQEYGSTVGTEWIDVHDNLIDAPVYTVNGVRIRGGKGIVWNNTIKGYSYGLSLIEQTPQPTGPVYLFGNTVTGSQSTVGTGAVLVTSKPSGYVAYAYPHPLVASVVAVAGPDQAVKAASGTAKVTLTAAGSKVSTGTVKARRWFAKGGFLGEGATIAATLPVGVHVVVLEVERSDGEVSHDTVVVRVT